MTYKTAWQKDRKSCKIEFDPASYANKSESPNKNIEIGTCKKVQNNSLASWLSQLEAWSIAKNLADEVYGKDGHKSLKGFPMLLETGGKPCFGSTLGGETVCT